MPEKLYFKIYETGNSRVLACADERVLGKIFSEGNREVEVKESFYRGAKISGQELEKLLDECDSINLFGEKSVETALRKGFLRQEDVIKIQGVPHAIILKV